MAAVTFGSVGDIIAVVQIAWGLAQALTNSRGSAKEYQALIKELRGFDQALLQVVSLWQNYEETPELRELGSTATIVANEWRDVLVAFQVKIEKKYGSSLSAKGSVGYVQRVKDAPGKLKWLKEKDDIQQLRSKLHTASDTITMLCLAAEGTSNKLNHSAQQSRVERVYALLEDFTVRSEEQMALSKRMDEKLDHQANTSITILSSIKSSWVVLCDIRNIALDIRNLLSLLGSHIVAQQATPYALGTHWQQAPVTLEDARGVLVPIPLELVNTWEMFDMILAKRFEGLPGSEMVRRKEYAIEEGSSSDGYELNRASELSATLRPGQKINMCMVFRDPAEDDVCPRCQTVARGSSGSRTQCQNIFCKMWFQRIVEVDEEAIHQEVPMPIVPDAISLEEYTPGSNSEPSLSSARPQDFQRVRLLRRLLFKCYGCKRQVKELVQPLGNPSSEVYDYPGRKYQPGSDKSLAEAFCTDCVSQQNISSITRIVKDIFTVLLTRGTRGIGAIDQVLANDDRCKSPFTFAVVRETLKNMDFMWDSEEVKSLTINRPEGKSLAIQEGTCSCRETEEKNCGSCDVVKEGKTIEVSEVLPSGLFVEGENTRD